MRLKELVLKRFPDAKAHDLVTLFLTAVIAGSTFVYTMVAGWTLLEIRSGSSDTHALAVAAKQQAEKTTDVATFAGQISDSADKFSTSAERISANTTDAVSKFDRLATSSEKTALNAAATIKNTQEAFHKDQRAWLGLSEFHVVEFAEGKPLLVDFNFLNSGKTPARNVKQSAKYKLSALPVPGPATEEQAFYFQPAQSVPPQGHYVMHTGQAPKVGHPATPRESVSAQTISDHFQDIRDGRIILYYYGEMTYDDLSGDTHTTKFCVFLANPKTRDLSFCDDFNDLD